MKQIKLAGGRYEIDGNKINKLSDIEDAVRALKKPIPINALKMNEPFTVETTEGIMSGKKGDYLMEGINGEMYICPADIFEKSYDIIQ